MPSRQQHIAFERFVFGRSDSSLACLIIIGKIGCLFQLKSGASHPVTPMVYFRRNILPRGTHNGLDANVASGCIESVQNTLNGEYIYWR